MHSSTSQYFIGKKMGLAVFCLSLLVGGVLSFFVLVPARTALVEDFPPYESSDETVTKTDHVVSQDSGAVREQFPSTASQEQTPEGEQHAQQPQQEERTPLPPSPSSNSVSPSDQEAVEPANLSLALSGLYEEGKSVPVDGTLGILRRYVFILDISNGAENGVLTDSVDLTITPAVAGKTMEAFYHAIQTTGPQAVRMLGIVPFDLMGDEDILRARTIDFRFESEARPHLNQTRSYKLDPVKSNWGAGTLYVQAASEASSAGLDRAMIVGAQVLLYDSSGDNLIRQVVTGAGGGYKFQDLEPDSYMVAVSYAGATSEKQRVLVQADDEAEHEQSVFVTVPILPSEVNAAPVNIQGRVTHHNTPQPGLDGIGVAAIPVKLFRVSGQQSYSAAEEVIDGSGEVLTNESGEYVFDNLSADYNYYVVPQPSAGWENLYPPQLLMVAEGQTVHPWNEVVPSQ